MNDLDRDPLLASVFGAAVEQMGELNDVVTDGLAIFNAKEFSKNLLDILGGAFFTAALVLSGQAVEDIEKALEQAIEAEGV